LLALVLALAGSLGPAADEVPDSIAGVWATEPTARGQARIRIEANRDSFDGTIVWLSEPSFPPSEPPEFAGQAKTDRHNPDPSLRGRPLLGLQLLRGLRQTGGSTFKGGTIYDPESGRTYRCQARLTDDGTLRFRGYIGVSLLGRTTIWTRVPDPADDGRGSH